MNRKVFEHMLIDCHNHSLYSFDGQEKVADLCKNAGKLGLSVFALTDHCDMIDGIAPDALISHITGSVNELTAWRDAHRDGNCRMLIGIELGDPLENLPLAEEMLNLCPYDLVIGSVHTDGVADYYFGDYSQTSEQELHERLVRSFDRPCEMAEWAKFDVLAHITYPLRYIIGDYGRKVNLDRYQQLIDQLFYTIIRKGIVLEVNTSGLRQKIASTLPDEALLRRYYGLGGRLVTIGSDAHRLRDMAFGITETEEMLRKIGFTELVWFDQRRMQKMPL